MCVGRRVFESNDAHGSWFVVNSVSLSEAGADKCAVRLRTSTHETVLGLFSLKLTYSKSIATVTAVML